MKLNTKKTIYVGLAFIIICMFWQVYDNIIYENCDSHFIGLPHEIYQYARVIPL